MSRVNSKESWEDDDDDFIHKLVLARMQQQRILQTPEEVVMDYLKSLGAKYPYAIIGGKAAVFHLSKRSRSKASRESTTERLAKATTDIDIIIPKAKEHDFMKGLQNALREKANRSLEQKEYHADDITIHLIGELKREMFSSVVDVHVVKSSNMPSVDIGDDGIRYANKQWVCSELKYSIEHHSSMDEPSKALKRNARYKLLQCE